MEKSNMKNKSNKFPQGNRWSKFMQIKKIKNDLDKTNQWWLNYF